MLNCGIIKTVEGLRCFNLPIYGSPLGRRTPSTSCEVNQWAVVFGDDMIDDSSGIYEIINIVNGHRYIGSASYLYKRWSGHKSELRQGKHHSRYLQRAWNKYGEVAFEFNVLTHVPVHCLLRFEQLFVYEESPEYNMATVVSNTSLGYRHTEEAKRKMSEIRLKMPPELRSKHSSAAQKCRKINKQLRENMSNGLCGHVVSEDTKRKIGLASLGNSRAKGSIRTEAQRLHLSEVQRAIWKARKEKEVNGN